MNRCRNMALRFVRHATRILCGAQLPWAKAMQCELHYIGNDAAALRWALGCVLASYKIRLSHWPWFSARIGWRCAAAGAGLIFLGVVSFEGYASGQTVHADSSCIAGNSSKAAKAFDRCELGTNKRMHQSATRYPN
jgi:hypothetical protein